MTPETTYESANVRCPYCLKLQSDSWEMGDGGEGCDTMECGHCEKEFTWARSFSVTYKGIPLPSATEKALEEIAKQHLADEMDDHSSENADWEGGYEAIVKIARAALSSENSESSQPKDQ